MAPVSTRDLVLFSSGSLGLNALSLFLMAKILWHRDPGGGLVLTPLAVAVAILTIGRILDGVLDPWIGSLSDRIRGPWGRRRSFMVVSLPLVLVGFAALWFPPFDPGPRVALAGMGGTQIWNAGHLALSLALFFTAYAAYGIPYDAALAEWSGNPQDRLRLSRAKALAGLLGVILTLPVMGLSSVPMAALVVTALAGVAMALPFLAMPPGDRNAMAAVRVEPFRWRRLFQEPPFIRFLVAVFFMEGAGALFLKTVEYYHHHALPATGGIFPIPVRHTALYLAFVVAMVGGMVFWEARGRRLRSALGEGGLPSPEQTGLRRAIVMMGLVFPLAMVPPFLPAPMADVAAVLYFALCGFAYGAVALYSIALLAHFAGEASVGDGASALHIGAHAFIRKAGLAAGAVAFALHHEGARLLGLLPPWAYGLSGVTMALLACPALYFLAGGRKPPGSPTD